jgi:signal peptidase I
MNPGPPSATADTSPPPSAPEAGSSRSRVRWLVVLAVAFVLTLAVRGLVVQSFFIPSRSMEPTLEPGDRILVSKVGAAATFHRGDVVVFDGNETFALHKDDEKTSTGLTKVVSDVAAFLSIRTDETDYVKRIVGMPGDRVVCCDAQGRISVNGTAVSEPYLYHGDKPSDLTFDVTVPAGHVWVMGDHRSDSADSRAHLGDPGGGMVREEDVIGRVVLVYWPLPRAGVLSAPGELAGIPSATTAGAR